MNLLLIMTLASGDYLRQKADKTQGFAQPLSSGVMYVKLCGLKLKNAQQKLRTKNA